MKNKISLSLLAATMLVLPFLLVNVRAATSAELVPNYGEVPRDVLWASDIVSGSTPVVLNDIVAYEKVDGSSPAIFVKDLESGVATKIADNAKDLSYYYDYNNYDASNSEVGPKMLYYSRYTDVANEFDLYAYDLINGVEHEILSKPGNQIKPQGYSDDVQTYLVYLDVIDGSAANIAQAYSNYSTGSDENYVLGVDPGIDFVPEPGNMKVYYESGSDLVVYDHSETTSAPFASNAQNPSMRSIDEIVYEKVVGGNSDIYLTNFTFDEEFVLADSSLDETLPRYSVTGDLSYVLETGSGSKIVARQFMYDNTNNLVPYSEVDISDNASNINTRQNSFMGYYVWTGEVGGQVNLYGFDLGLLNRYSIGKAGDYTFWGDSMDTSGPRWNYYNETTDTKRTINLPEYMTEGYNYKADEDYFVITGSDKYVDNDHPNKDYLYKYTLESDSLSLLIPKNDDYAYNPFGVSQGKLLYNRVDYTDPENTVITFHMMDLASTESSSLSFFDTITRSVAAFRGDYILYTESGDLFRTVDLKLYNTSTQEVTTVTSGFDLESLMIFALDVSMGENMVVWTDGDKIYTYHLETGEGSIIDEPSAEGIFKAFPKEQGGIIVWQEYRKSFGMGFGNGPLEGLAGLFKAKPAFAGSDDRVVAYGTASGDVLGSFPVNLSGGQVTTYLADGTLYYQDQSDGGLKVLYSADLDDVASSGAPSLSNLPDAGIGYLAYVLFIGLSFGTVKLIKKAIV